MSDKTDIVERLRARDLPPEFCFVGDRVEQLFDPENRHRSGVKATDYLASWLSMLRPFAFASRSDSWGELEKLLCIVMRNYVEVHRLCPEAATLIEQQAATILDLRERVEKMEGAWQWLDENSNAELSFTRWDEDVQEWQVHLVNGGRNDQEWVLFGSGETPLDAVCAARTTLGEANG